MSSVQRFTLFLLSSAAVVGFEQSLLTVDEAAGSLTVSVSVLSGILGISVVTELLTSDGLAEGKFTVISFTIFSLMY